VSTRPVNISKQMIAPNLLFSALHCGMLWVRTSATDLLVSLASDARWTLFDMVDMRVELKTNSSKTLDARMQ